ncbi:MAG: ABC transporter ATP-binding protein [Anaerolineae bacterium]
MIRIEGLSKDFGGVNALRDVTLTLPPGSITVLYGLSGSGKTTLLRLIAGLEVPAAGEIRIGDELASSPSHMQSPHQRGIGFVFQDAALWPHMNVYQNVAFGLLGRPRHEVKQRVQAMLKALALTELARRYPGQISGGQARRVSLARTLVTQPQRLLLDEPLTHIDPEMKARVLDLIAQQIAERTMTVLYVTHAPHEADRLGGRKFRMVAGSIEVDSISSGEPRHDVRP